MIPFHQIVAAANVQSVGSYGVGGGGDWNGVGEGKYLSSLSPSGFDILDERSGLGTARAVQPFRSYLFDGVNDAIEWTTADIGTLYASWYDVTNKVWDSGTITHGSGKYSFSPGGNVAISNLKIWTDNLSTTEEDQAFELASIPGNLWFWGKCDDTHDTIAYDSNGGTNNGTKTNITPATFHAEGGTGWLPRSWQNDVGYSPRQLLGNGAGGIQGDFTTQTDATFYCEFTPGAVTSSGDICYLLMSDFAASVGGQFGLVMQHFSAGRKIHYGNKSLRSSNDFSVGARNTAAIVRDDSEDEVTIRLNGTDTLTSSTAGVHASTDVIASGMKVTGGSPDFGTASAVISRCRVFDRALSASELDTLENGGEVSSGLLVSWDFDHSDTIINAADPGVSDGVQVGTRTDIFVSRDESDTANDVLGDPLDYVGPVPRNVVAVNSNCVEFAGTGDYISAPHLGGTETVVSSGGTSTPTVSAGRIDFTAGTCWYLELSDGTLYPLSEGEGTDHYDPAGGNHAQAMNTGGGYRTTDQSSRPSNLLDGYSLYEHATLDPIRVPYGSDGNPLSITPPTGYTKTSDHPAGAWHNGAETQINFKAEPDASWVHQIEDASGESIPDQYSHGDALPSFMTKVTDANGNESQFMINEVE